MLITKKVALKQNGRGDAALGGWFLKGMGHITSAWSAELALG